MLIPLSVVPTRAASPDREARGGIVPHPRRAAAVPDAGRPASPSVDVHVTDELA
jgi:hypothetical protein